MNYIKISRVQNGNISIVTEITTNNFSVLIKVLSESTLVVHDSEIKSMKLIESTESFHIVVGQIDRLLPAIAGSFNKHIISGGIVFEW
ncbi:hypothetical protein BSK59_13515 [Paenibacillus odorifer]|uniref:hypothetical protein n=1 Tax=Paenibacillus TaxID=44249 RepID=UPI00096EF0E8|nr:hypothetical protein [Paenibacillus odorifer]OME55489.1 hypothetical protein BSK59_13515 [Paenibacillus odorifer]